MHAEPAFIPVDDLSDPRLADYADLRDAEKRPDRAAGARGQFIAEGELVVRLLLRSPYRVRSVLLATRRRDALAPVLQPLPPGVPVYLLPQEAMNRLVGFNIHRGVLAAVERGAGPDLPSILAGARSLLILENLANHDNVGGIFRNAAALAEGAAVLLNPGCCDPLYRKAVRVSLGHVLMTPFARAEPWPEVLERVRAAGFTLVALTPAPDARPIDAVQVARPALLLGAEGPGLTAGALAAADLRVRIPLAPGVDSLNVAVAAAIALHRLTPVRTRRNSGTSADVRVE